jgi:ubiquinone/menaquinone biosynthesis C-methylase UbiE
MSPHNIDRMTGQTMQQITSKAPETVMLNSVVSGTPQGNSMGEPGRTYLPATGNHWALPLYDPLVKLLGADTARAVLLEQAALRPGHRVLDIGCGTGTLAVLIKRQHPDVEIVGLDPDPTALARARRKAQRAALSIQLDQGFSDELPYAERSFDRVFSSFMLHHLTVSEREATLREVRRVLKPGARLHLLDFATPDPKSAGRLSRWLHSGHRLKDNSDEQIVSLMRQAGLADPNRVAERTLLVGHIAYYHASAPTSRP